MIWDTDISDILNNISNNQDLSKKEKAYTKFYAVKIMKDGFDINELRYRQSTDYLEKIAINHILNYVTIKKAA